MMRTEEREGPGKCCEAVRSKIEFHNKWAVLRYYMAYHYFIAELTMMSSIYPRADSLPNGISLQVRYPEDIQIIIRADTHTHGSLFLSNLEAAQNPQLLQKLQIAAVVTAARGHHLTHPKNIVKIVKYIPLEEDQKCQIYDFLEETVSFIDQKLKITNVLLHCVSGNSRAAALAVAYLMGHRHLSLEDAFNEVKSRRRIIAPSIHILRQLKKYEIDLQQKKVAGSLPMERGNLSKLTIKSGKVSSPGDRLNIGAEKLKTQGSQMPKMAQKNQQSKGQSNNLLLADFDQVKSMRSHRSSNSRRSNQICIGVNPPVKNPEDSFISKNSQKSVIHKSFAKSGASSQGSGHYSNSQYPQQLPDAPQLTKKLSQSRQEFTKKMRKVDSLNEQINFKIDAVQQRFETESKTHKLNLDKELSEIYQMKTQIYSQQNQRKSRLATKRSFHNETMDDRQVRNYIYELPVPGLIV